MRKLLLSLLLTFIFSSPNFTAPSASLALDTPTMMFFGQKRHPESLARSSRVFEQTLTEVTDILLNEYELDVKDEVSVSGTYSEPEGPRSKAELAEIARQAKCDVAVIFEVTPYVEDVNGFKKVRAQLFLEAFTVDRATRVIGKVDVSTEEPVAIRAPFQKPQIMEAAGEASKALAAQAADALGKQIESYFGAASGMGSSGGLAGGASSVEEEKGRIYTLIFKQFKTGEVEDTLAAFTGISGYVSHRHLAQNPRETEVEYRSTADRSVLSSEFDLILKDLNFPVSRSGRSNDIILTKVRVRGSRQ